MRVSRAALSEATRRPPSRLAPLRAPPPRSGALLSLAARDRTCGSCVVGRSRCSSGQGPPAGGGGYPGPPQRGTPWSNGSAVPMSYVILDRPRVRRSKILNFRAKIRKP